ncbi:hypothetical protein [Kribbella sp. NPDC004875]|uniref:hypothetical protein n=1 Tax=Kribbella sp. NPDC004875 TaxID=3364107 RepID=UPI00367AF130
MADRFDLDAIEADDALLDLLAAGGESARAAGEHDPAVQLLADLRLAVEVEDELPVETIDDPESFLARCAALNPITDPFARKVATRGLALGVAAVAALSVSGVAAAVTGDPLSPYEKVIEKMVDAVRPQTSFPKEELDGLPVLDKTKIVKVAKDYQKIKAEHGAQTGGKDGSTLADDPNARTIPVMPPLVTPPEKPLAILDQKQVGPTDPAKTQDPGKPIGNSKSDDGKTDPPTDTTTGGKDTTDTPTTPPDTPTTPTPTGDPTEPGSSTTTGPTDPTTTTTTTPSAPANVDTGTGDNAASGDPTATPSSDSGSGQTGTSNGSEGAAPGSDSGTGTTTPGSGTGATDGTSGTDTSGAGSTATPSSEVTQTPSDLANAVSDLIGQAISPILPTPTGAPVAVESAERFFGATDTPATTVGSTPVAPKAPAKKSTAKHSSGKVSTGSVRKTYPTGKHSTGAYPEGKHAAIDRTHGSTDDASLLKILGIVNTPTK